MCEPDRGKKSIIFSFILRVPPPVRSYLSPWDCLPAKVFLFISKGVEDFRTDHWQRRLGSVMFALSYWFHRCLEVNDTQHLMILSYMSNKRHERESDQRREAGGTGQSQQHINSFLSPSPRPCRDWWVLLQMEDGLIFLKLLGSNEVLIHLP